MELLTLILFLSLVLAFVIFFITRKDWRVLLVVVPVVFLIPFTLELDHDLVVTYQYSTLGCGDVGTNASFNVTCSYYPNTMTYNLDPSLMTAFNLMIFLGVILLVAYAVTEAFEKY